MTIWIQTGIFVQAEMEKQFLLQVLKPLIQQLRDNFEIASYHFLYEPNHEIRFRVLTEEENVAEITTLIDGLRGNQLVTDLVRTPYDGETVNFGVDGWVVAYKFLEVGSDYALSLIDNTVRKGPRFNTFDFSHFFLNQQGLNAFGEATTHFQCSMERMLTIQEGNVQPLKEQIARLQERIRLLEEHP